MNLYLRLFRVWLGSLATQRLHYTAGTETYFRVWPHDLDAFGHMNNGRYLQIMDVARTHWMLRSGIAATIRRHRWAPLLGGGLIRYRHSLRFWQPYRVHTQLLGWDGQWFFLEHVFFDQGNRRMAIGISRAGLRANGTWVPSTTVAKAVDPEAVSPTVPDYIRHWLGLEEVMYEHSGTQRAAEHVSVSPEQL